LAPDSDALYEFGSFYKVMDLDEAGLTDTDVDATEFADPDLEVAVDLVVADADLVAADPYLVAADFVAVANAAELEVAPGGSS
jgi:hypothetical protein